MRTWIFSLLCLSIAGPNASAFLRSTTSSGAPLRRSDSTNINFLINERTAPGLTNSQGGVTITADSDPLGALQSAMDTWTNVSTSTVVFAPAGRTSKDSSVNDREHIISFVDTPANRSTLGDAIAITLTVFDSRTGQINDTDILFNPTLTFSTTLEANTFDIQAVATHELGHSLGASHSGLSAATMYFASRRASNSQSMLAADDIAFVTDTYPQPAALNAFGSISGTLRLDNGNGVAVGLVTAINPSTGIAVGTFTGADGKYSIAKIPPGNYVLYAEPMDGPVLPDQIGRQGDGANVNFLTTVLGGADAPQTVPVKAGQDSAADLTAQGGPPAMNIQGGGVTLSGGSIPLSGGAFLVQPGQTLIVAVFGKGLDDPSITEDSFSFIGAPVAVQRGSLRRGTTSASNLPVVAVMARVLPTPSQAGQAPVITAAGVVNAASFRTGPVAPGEIVSIFGTGMGPGGGMLGGLDPGRAITVLVRSANSAAVHSTGLKIAGGLTTSLGDTTVTFNGVRAPLFFVSANQINAQAPFELAGQSSADVVVTFRSVPSATVQVPVATSGPGIFMGSGTQGIVLNQDGSLNGAASPAARGSVVVAFATGQGSLGPPLITGQLAPLAPLSRASQTVSASIGGRPATVFFAGMTPSFVGLLQVNVQVPGDAPTGANVPLSVKIGSNDTQPNVTIAVR